VSSLAHQKFQEEIMRKVRQVEIKTKRLVEQILAGEYKTAFKGQGMTFADFREYVAGDDVRNISWTQTAKAGKTFIKTFEEERELQVVMVVDVSASTEIGAQSYMKSELLAMIAGVLGMSASQNQDHIGLVLFSDRIEKYIPAKKGRGQVQLLMRELFFHEPQSQKTNMAQMLTFLSSILKKKSYLFVFSDFQSENFINELKFLTRKHQVVCGLFNQRVEQNLQGLGLIEIEDPETGETAVIDTDSPELIQKIAKIEQARVDELKATLKSSGADVMEFNSHDFDVTPLVKYFQTRRRRR